jgi:hypothetical protein
MRPTVAHVIEIAQKLMPVDNDKDEEDGNDSDDDEDYDMFYIVEDDHGSISVTSEDIIGASMAFGGSSSKVSRKSLIADAKLGRRASRGPNALRGSVVGKDGGRKQR